MNAVPAQAATPGKTSAPWAFERKLALGYVGAAILVFLMVVLCSWQGARFVGFNYQVEHTHEVIDTVESIRELVTDAETNQRGYWILGDEKLSRDAETAINALPERLRDLGELLADNPVQNVRLRELTNTVRDKAARTRANLEEIRKYPSLAALLESGYVTGNGQQLRLRLQAVAQEMIASEQELLRERIARRRSGLHAVSYSLVGLGALLGVLLAAIYRLGDVELRARRRMSRELEFARDAALEATRQKSEFLANMSHEIRTPLNGIVGMAGLLREQSLEPGARDCASTIDTCAEALLGVINDVLDFSKIEAGRLSFAHVSFDLRETIDETLAILAARANDKGLELNALISQDVPAGLLGDPVRLRQVLLNLLGNAVKFTERGEVALHVSHVLHQTAGTTAPGETIALRFEVRDTGIGIAPEFRSRLFQAFSQVDGSNTRRHGGTGLGLVISRELVAGMGGEIGVESEPGVGSAFWFTARLEVDLNLAGVRANTLPPAAADKLQGWRVLLAGEPSADRRHVQQMFTNWELFHQSADDGHRALAMLRLAAASGRPFDVALLDADLSGLNGRALAAEVRADPAVAGTRLILLSDAPSGVSVALSPDLDARLPRPVRSRMLLETLRRLAETPSSPAADPAAPAAVATPTDLPAEVGPRVLLAEDNPVNRKVAIRQLENLGCHATSAPNGRELLALVEAGDQFDLILMDIQMPEMDGYETTRQLRSRFWSIGLGPPVVAMTANAMSGDREKCLAAGMDDYLPKPVKQDALEAVLRRWLPPRANVNDASLRDRETVSVNLGK